MPFLGLAFFAKLVAFASESLEQLACLYFVLTLDSYGIVATSSVWFCCVCW